MNYKERLLLSRGISEKDIEPKKVVDLDFDAHDFRSFCEEPFIVVTDMDVDGMSAANVVREYFPDVKVYCPPANMRGVSSPEYVTIILEDNPSANLLVLDHGTNEVGIEKLVNKMGREILVVDHHLPITPVESLINPMTGDGEFKSLSASSLVYLLLEKAYGYKASAIAYASIGTIVDMVPVFYDNRYVIKNGIEEIRKNNAGRLSAFLKEVGSFIQTEKDVSFSVGPILNSPRRLDKHHVAVSAYIDSSPMDSLLLSNINEERKQIVQDALDGAEFVVHEDDSVIVLYDGPPGISGLVASGATKLYNASAMAISRDGTTGSIRGFAPIATDFVEASAFVSGGGHKVVAGFKINDVAKIDDLAKEFAEFYKDSRPQASLSPDLVLDFDEALVASIELEDLSPFGVGFPEPLYRSTVQLVDNGTTKSGRKSVLVNDTKGMIWTKEDLYIPEDPVIIDYRINNNRFRGNIYPFFTIISDLE